MLRFTLYLTLGGLLACAERPETGDDSATVVAPPAETPVFEIGLWPGEGIPVLSAVRDSLPLRAEPLVRAALVGALVTAAGSRVAYDSARTQTIAAGRATAIAAAQIAGRDFGERTLLLRADYYASIASRHTIDVAAGTVVDYLQPRAEGTCFVRVQGIVLEADPCIVLDRSRFTLDAEPTLRWWVHVSSTGTTPGWVIVSDSTVKLIDRTF